MDENFIDVDITQFYESCLKLNKECEAAKIAKALDLAKSGNLIIARDILKDILVSKPRSVRSWMALNQISMKLYCWEDAEFAAKRVLDIKKNKIKDKLLYKMKETLVEATSLTNDKSKWETAFRMCEQVRILFIYTCNFLNLKRKQQNSCLELSKSLSKSKSIFSNLFKVLKIMFFFFSYEKVCLKFLKICLLTQGSGVNTVRSLVVRLPKDITRLSIS